MSESEQTLAVVRQVFAAFAAHDLRSLRDLLHPDVVLPVGGGPATITGADAVVAAVSVTTQAIPDLRVTVTSAFAQGPLAAAEVKIQRRCGAPGINTRRGGRDRGYHQASVHCHCDGD